MEQPCKGPEVGTGLENWKGGKGACIVGVSERASGNLVGNEVGEVRRGGSWRNHAGRHFPTEAGGHWRTLSGGIPRRTPRCTVESVAGAEAGG